MRCELRAFNTNIHITPGGGEDRAEETIELASATEKF